MFIIISESTSYTCINTISMKLPPSDFSEGGWKRPCCHRSPQLRACHCFKEPLVGQERAEEWNDGIFLTHSTDCGDWVLVFLASCYLGGTRRVPGTGARDISAFTATPCKDLGQTNQVQFWSVSSGCPYRCPRMERACPLVDTW